MFLLMDASSRFGGLMGRVETLQTQDQEILLAYLERHATNTLLDKESVYDEGMGSPWLARTLALLPFLLLTGLGLLRWWRGARRDHKPCATD